MPESSEPPRSETNSTTALPLAGIRVVDLTWIVAGPTCTRVLADFGAEVIRVENQQTIDSIRFGRPHPHGFDPPDSSAFFNWLDRNKKSITLNARHPEGFEALKKLIAVSDVVIENYSTYVMENWGLSYDDLKSIREDIVYVSLSGFGHSGPDRHYSTWGPTAQALSGLTAMSGMPGMPAAGWGYSYMDHTAGYSAAIATLSALRHRQVSGEGQHIDLSQVEAGLVLCGPAILDKTVNDRSYRRPGNPPGNRAAWPKVAPHNTYRCQGDPKPASSWLMITCETHDQWVACAEALGHAEWATQDRFATLPARLRNQDELDALIGAITNHHDARALMEKLQAVGVPAGVVQDLPAVVHDDPQMQARGFTVENEHEVIGPHLTDGTPAHLSRTPAQRRAGGPLLGQDNDDILGDLLGYSEEERMELLINGALG